MLLGNIVAFITSMRYTYNLSNEKAHWISIHVQVIRFDVVANNAPKSWPARALSRFIKISLLPTFIHMYMLVIDTCEPISDACSLVTIWRDEEIVRAVLSLFNSYLIMLSVPCAMCTRCTLCTLHRLASGRKRRARGRAIMTDKYNKRERRHK